MSSAPAQAQQPERLAPLPTQPRKGACLALLVFAMTLTLAAFAEVGLARDGRIPSGLLVYGGGLAVLAGAAFYVQVRFAPFADPLLLPLAVALNGLGLAMIYRLDLSTSKDFQDAVQKGGKVSNAGLASAATQLQWTFVGILLFAVVVVLLKDSKILQRYVYTLGALAIILLLLPIVPGLGAEINGARVWIFIGPFSVQPGEFAKLLLVIFLAGYLRERRELLTMAHRRVLGVGLPAARHLGPLLAMTGVALGVVAVMNDMGTALLLYGIFLAMVYVATGRQLYTVAGLALFVGGSFLVYHLTPHVQERFQVWLDPWKTPHTNGYQIIQSIESIADGGIFGSGLGRSFQVFSNGSSVIPAAQTDGIYAVWANETGLAGAAGMLLIYLLFAYRGFKIASVADDSFSKLLAAGLTFTVVLQAFLIVGGITRLIPLTGITLPFVSYGGSSVVSNFMLLALLLMVSSRTARVRR